MTSSNENTFRVTGPLCWEFIVHQGIPLTKASDRALMFSLICVLTNGWVNNHGTGGSRCHCTHYYVIVMYRDCKHDNVIFKCLDGCWIDFLLREEISFHCCPWLAIMFLTINPQLTPNKLHEMGYQLTLPSMTISVAVLRLVDSFEKVTWGIFMANCSAFLSE